MNIQLGQYAGFCFGVDRAVSMVEEATKAGGTVVTLGPIIHNHHVVDRFQRMGVEVANSPEEVRPGSTVVLRAHGVPRQVEETLAGLPVQVVDATCPFVKRIHRLVQEAEAGKSGLLQAIFFGLDYQVSLIYQLMNEEQYFQVWLAKEE